MKGFALGLALRQRQNATRKLPIICVGGLLENYKSLLRPPAQVLTLYLFYCMQGPNKYLRLCPADPG